MKIYFIIINDERCDILTRKLQKAKISKKDEFYTQLSDIERELVQYKNKFKDKVVYCNCDDPKASNFLNYFLLNFNNLGLKKIIASSYKSSKQGIYIEYEREKIGNRIPTIEELELKYMKGDGDFRSKECIELLKQADIVVTNPPFSLFREYVAQLIEYDKKFIIIGHQNAISYKEIFKLIKENKIWLGYGFKGGATHFINRYYEDYASANDHKEGMIRVSGVTWFTNLDTSKRHEDLVLHKKYKPEEYKRYENFNGININKTKDIPIDYKGFMGVPITFLNKYNPEQFEIVGLGISSSGLECGVQPYKEEHKRYRREVQRRGAVDGDLYMIIDGIVKVPYARIIIRNKML